MAKLQKQIARELAIEENADGYWQYTIKEGDKLIIESDLYQTSLKCSTAGVRFMDVLHEECPIRSDYIPAAADFIYAVPEEKK